MEVIGASPAVERQCRYFAEDPVRGNIAELAFGRSDRLGGITGVAAFKSPATDVHQDIVYAQGNPIGVARADLVAADGKRTTAIRNGSYVLWQK